MHKNFTTTIGIILVLLGLLGFVSNPLIGQDALFVANSAANWLHFIAGVAILASALL